MERRGIDKHSCQLKTRNTIWYKYHHIRHSHHNFLTKLEVGRRNLWERLLIYHHVNNNVSIVCPVGKFLCDVGVRIVCKDLCKIPPIVCVWPRLSRSLLQNWLGLSIPYYLRHTENHLHHHLYIPFHNLIIGVEGKERYLIRLMQTLRWSFINFQD